MTITNFNNMKTFHTTTITTKVTRAPVRDEMPVIYPWTDVCVGVTYDGVETTVAPVVVPDPMGEVMAELTNVFKDPCAYTHKYIDKHYTRVTLEEGDMTGMGDDKGFKCNRTGNVTFAIHTAWGTRSQWYSDPLKFWACHPDPDGIGAFVLEHELHRVRVIGDTCRCRWGSGRGRPYPMHSLKHLKRDTPKSARAFYLTNGITRARHCRLATLYGLYREL